MDFTILKGRPPYLPMETENAFYGYWGEDDEQLDATEQNGYKYAPDKYPTKEEEKAERDYQEFINRDKTYMTEAEIEAARIQEAKDIAKWREYLRKVRKF